MNRRLFALAVLLFVLLYCAPSLAHSGRTDANGGHRDSSTGEYHYHHGYPAHQHTNGECPYDFDDKTGWNSGEASKQSVSILDNKTGWSSKEASKQSVSVAGKEFSTDTIIALSGAGVSSAVAIGTGISLSRKKEEIRSIQQNAACRESELRDIISDLGGIKPQKLIPPGTSIGDDGLPVEDDWREFCRFGWGEKYTFFKTYRSNTYHRHGCRYAGIYKVHAVNAKKLRPCKKCNPVLPDMDWFSEYNRLVMIKKKYDL